MLLPSSWFFKRYALNVGMTILCLVLPSVQAAELRVDNFVLLDHKGEAHELYYHSDAKAIVLIAHGNGCQIVRSNLDGYKRLRSDYVDKGVEVLMLNSNLQDNSRSIVSEAKEWGVDLPILDDRSQIVGKSLRLNRTAEVLVIDPRSWTIVYRGPLNNRVDYERQKSQASEFYVRDALNALIAGQEFTFKKVNSPGCIINFGNEDGGQISYSDTIAPLLISNCVACHRKGGIAPWAMSEYNMIKGFAPMMREVVRTKRMPPWHADPEIGHWANDASLSDDETRALIDWIEAGAPRGGGDDPLLKVSPLKNRWTLGEPDLVIDIPQFEVPASGIVEYQFPSVANPVDRDVWVVAAAIIPGDPKAVHHILAGASSKGSSSGLSEDIFESMILTYAPGNEASRMPEGTGVFVPKGGVYQFQLHYTPYGKKTIDSSKIGLYFSDTPPENFYREHVLLNPRIKIPANAPAHEERAYLDFTDDAVIYALFPHAHYRGRSSKFELEYPDGENETLLSVPNYDFNWQRTYQLVTPKQVPAGTRLIHRTIYDNSANNRGNPDPSVDVHWGLQSAQEMLYGSVGYSWLNETTDKPTHDRIALSTAKTFGYMDQDMDGRVTKTELSPYILRRIQSKWDSFDNDADGGLSLNEMILVMQSLTDG